MENEPLLASQPCRHIGPSPEFSPWAATTTATTATTTAAAAAAASIPHSTSTPSFLQEIVQHQDRVQEDQEEISDSDPESRLGTPFFTKPRTLHRCRTAPAMIFIKDVQPKRPQVRKPSLVSKSLIERAIFLLIVYLTLGVAIYSFYRDHYSGIETNPVVDALYFCIVTMCTIGYGDIAPLTPATKIFAVVFVLFGFGFLDILLCGVLNYVLDLQQNMILTGIEMSSSRKRKKFSARDYIVDVEKGRMRIRLKVGLALFVVILCIGVGALVLYYVERLDWIDSVYLAVMSVTTVGYGDTAFKTWEGRLFAAIWLFMSTLAVARAFLYLVEARIDRRHRKIVKWSLDRDITVEDLFNADTYRHGIISKSEYIILKLKEMGKIGAKDISLIANQFEKLDPNHLGKITLPDLWENHS